MNENFNVEKVVNEIIEFIKEHFKKNNIDGVVIGISGGKDSTVASALFTKAIGKENVIGINMPCHSIISDENDAKKVADYLGFKLKTVDLTKVYDLFEEVLKKELKIENKEILNDSNINLKPRMRMSSLYYFAQALSNKTGKRYVVAGTGNKCEIALGYFTKWGDGASDINILGDLTVSEIKVIGDYLGLPKELVHKVPSDGLSGKSDKEKLGFSYDEVEEFLKGNNNNAKIIKMNKNSLHKRKTIPVFKKNNTYEIIKEIVSILKNENKTISTMESCTSGLVASTITNVDGASQVLKFSAITYSNEYKIKLGVDPNIIDKYSVYSKEVSIEMAKNITKYANSNYGIGVTGKLGLEDEDNPYGNNNKVYIALYNKDKDIYETFNIIINEKEREYSKIKVVEFIILKLKNFINK